LNRLAGAWPADWYVLQWQQADGQLRKIASRRCPIRVLNAPVTEGGRALRATDRSPITVRARTSPEAPESLLCRLNCPAGLRDDIRVRRATEALVRQSLLRLLGFVAERRRTRMAHASGETQRTHLFLFDRSGRLLEQLPAAWDGIPDAVSELALQLVTGRSSRRKSLSFQRAGQLYDLKHRWLPGDPPGSGRALLVEARPRDSLASLVRTQFDRFALTKREAQIAQLILQGATNREIADELDISADTVKTHCRHLFGKLDIARRSEILKVFSRQEVGLEPNHRQLRIRFVKMAILGPACEGRYVRLDAGAAFFKNLRDDSRIRVEKGGVGYCYAASTVLSVGFNRDMKPPLPPGFGYPTFDYCVQLEPRLVPFLSISLDRA
jgi:DNA-binding CsgD family transcriptional regulator